MTRSNKKKGKGGHKSHPVCKEPEKSSSGNSSNDINAFLTKQYSEVLGRYLTAKKNLQPGSIILEENPLVIGPCQNSAPSCLGCYTPIPDVKTSSRCNLCKWPLCSSSCPGLNQEFGHSQEECTFLSRVPADKVPNDQSMTNYNPIVPIRALVQKSSNPEKWNKIIAMESHNNIRRAIPIIWNTNQITVVNKIRQDWKIEDFTEDEIHTICGILEVNSFSIGNTDQSLRGIYPTCYLFSHDCVPNTSHIDLDDYKMCVRANVFVRKGEPVTLTYTSTIKGTLARREHLKISKFFDCVCPRCSDPTELGTFASALKCLSCDSGYLLPDNPLNSTSVWVCYNASSKTKSSKCSKTLPAEEVKKILDSVNRDSQTINEDIRLYEQFIKKYSNILHKNHYYLIEAKYSLSQMYGKLSGYLIHEMSEEQLKRKIEICQDILQFFSIVEPGMSRLRGVTLYELQAPIMVFSTLHGHKLTKGELKKNMRQVINYLKEASNILDWEPQHTTEGQIKIAIQQALLATQDWNSFL